MKKSQKKYHLAVSFTKYPEIVQLPSPKETRQQKKEKDTSHAYDSLENMFNNNFEMRLRKLEIEQRRNYEVVGYKEIQDIHLRLERKKRLLKSGTKEDKQTELSRGSIIKNSQDFLTKDEVIRHFSPHYLTVPSSRQSKQRATEARSLKISKIMTKDTKNMSIQVKKDKASQSKVFSICKLRQKMEEYQSGWIKQIEHKRKLVRKVMRPIQNPMISVIESVDQYRANSEERQKAIIEQKILSCSIWEKILRTSKETGSKFKEITNISANGLKSIGRDKYRKELEWLEDKDRNGYFFKKDSSLIEYSQVCCE